jgi:endo-alpha-1,4-polygalactosaminidase (GH114 family)
MITRGIVSHHRTSIIDHIMQTYRHANMSVLIASQSYKQLNKTTRSLNLSALVVLKVNKQEIEEVAKEHSGLLSENAFAEMYHKVMEDKRGYLFIDYKADMRNRFRDTINDVIEISE